MELVEQLERVKGYYREFAGIYRAYLEGSESVYAVERLAEIIAQSLLGFAAMLASRETGRKPGTYRELARWLARRAELGDELASFLEGLAGFRNILVHMYAEIDRRLEEQAFREILAKTPRVIEALERLARDPCLTEIIKKLKRAADEIKPRYILIFGSVARSGCGRDVDVAVKLGRKPSLLEAGRIQVILEDYLRAPVDLVVIDYGVPPTLAKTLVDEAIVVYGDEREARRDLLRMYLEYLDWAEEAKKLWTNSRRPRSRPRHEPPTRGRRTALETG